MFQLFEPMHTLQLPSVHPPGFELIKRIYQREIQTITTHYQSRSYYLDNQHILVRLLNSFAISINVPLERFIEIANTRSPYIAKLLNFTSSINFGKLHNGSFYGDGNMEIIISTDQNLNPFNLPNDWKSIQAVKVLEHPISDMGLQLPSGERKSTATGLCVISIDIPLLMYQYRCFQLDRWSMIDSEVVLNTNHFLYKYVLPNMLYSHIDLVILNRLMNLYYGAPMSRSIKQHSFPVVDYSDRIDYNLRYVEAKLRSYRASYSGYIQQIPSIFNLNIGSSLIVPDIARTKQVWWSMLVSRLRIMKFLIDIGTEEGTRTNRMYIGQLQIYLKRLKVENTLRMVLPRDMYFDVSMMIDEILSI